MSIEESIQSFLSASTVGVVGASSNREKYGNKILRCYQQHARSVVPINPRGDIIEGLPVIRDIASLPDDVSALSIITPPKISEQVVEAAIARGTIKHLWFQPGAQSPIASDKARQAGLNVIDDGSCLLVVLGYSEH